MRVSCFPSAIENVGEVPAGGEGKDFLERCFFAGVCLHEVLLGAGLGELWGEASELGEHFVDEADLKGKGVAVEVEGEEAADVACWGRSISCVVSIERGGVGSGARGST